MRIKPDTRNYGKDHPRYEQEKSVTRAGEDDSPLRNALDENLWFTKKDPYSKQDEVDPPADYDDTANKHPEDIRKRESDDI